MKLLLLDLRGELCILIILSSSLRFSLLHVSVSLRPLVMFKGFCSFSLDLWEEVVVRFLH